jgi:hypothetical protein
MSNAGGGVVQNISSLLPGRQYVISAWVNVAVGNAAVLVVDDSANSATQQITTQGATNGTWQLISLPFTADSTGAINVHLISNATGALYWDDVSVVQALNVGNYSFESGSMSSWTAFSGSNASISTSAAHAGSYSILMSNAGGGVVQNISSLLPGRQYVISAWVNVAVGNAAALVVDDSANSATQQTATQGATNGTWQLISLPFTADSTGAVNVHLISDGTGAIYWDDVSVVQEIGSFTISGQVTAAGSGLSGITVTLTGTTTAGTSISQTTTTDSNGNYAFSVPVGGTYEIQPSGSYTFTPQIAAFWNAFANETANFQVSAAGSPTSGTFVINATPPTKEYIRVNGHVIAIENWH